MELQQSPFLGLIPDRQLQRQLALIGQPKGARLTSAVAQQICERTASAMVLEGSIAVLRALSALERGKPTDAVEPAANRFAL